MDMEVIQEFSENQCYLNALSNHNFKEIEIKVPTPTPAQVEMHRLSESLSYILQEPVGKWLFHLHLRSTQSMDNLLLLDMVHEYDDLPARSTYRARIAQKIIQQYLTAGSSRQEIAVPPGTAEVLQAQLTAQGAVDHLFQQVAEAARLNLQLSALRAFVQSRYYSRLVGFRLKEKEPVTRETFAFIRILGEGGFGKVFAVSKFDTRALYACKTMSKTLIADKKRERLILNERDILAKVHHPCIVNLSYAFQDDQTLYLVLSLMSGGELGFHLNRFGVFPERMVRFYSAVLVLALEHLHSLDIVYRDLKPENVMLDADGFPRLTDLGLCAVIPAEGKLFQHCGTRSYMAPEQCYGDDGYGKAVDWWSLGVTIFHLITGSNPFSRRHRRSTRKDSEPVKPSAPVPIPSSNGKSDPLGATASMGSDQGTSVHNAIAGSAPSSIASVLSAIPPPTLATPANGSASSTPVTPAGSKPGQQLELTAGKATGNGLPRPTSSPVDSDAARAGHARHSPSKSSKKGRSESKAKSTRTFGFGWGSRKDDRDDEKRAETPEQRAQRYAALRNSYESTLATFPWPADMPKHAKSICQQLLQIDPTKRLGRNGAAEIKAHPFFDGMDWHRLRDRQFAPPFVPDRDYVNAKYLEAAATALDSNKKAPASTAFAGFEFTRPMIYQEEVMAVLRNKDLIAGSPPS